MSLPNRSRNSFLYSKKSGHSLLSNVVMDMNN